MEMHLENSDFNKQRFVVSVSQSRESIGCRPVSFSSLGNFMHSSDSTLTFSLCPGALFHMERISGKAGD